jgi:hypothetical protein
MRQSLSTATTVPWRPGELLRQPMDTAALLPERLDELLRQPFSESMVKYGQ